MTNTIFWQLLFVDDDSKTCCQVREYLESECVAGPDEHMRVETLADFTSALDKLDTHRFDLLILDVRLGSHDIEPKEEEGIKTLEAIQQRCFVPVVFYTGLPNLVRHLEKPLVRVVEKTQGFPYLLKTIGEIFATRLPSINRALIRHLETVQRDYMWGFVTDHWQKFSDTLDHTALAYLLARRLAISLSGQGIQQLAEDLGASVGMASAEGYVHPMQYYVVPPVQPTPLAGDLYKGCVEDQSGYAVFLTPSCDMAAEREKADWVLLARCNPLAEQSEYKGWRESPERPKAVTSRLQALLQNHRVNGQPERYYFLPGALTLPDLIVDFQQLVTLPREKLNSLDRLASLDSPFAEALLARFVRYFGRLGTPDLDTDVILRRLGQ